MAAPKLIFLTMNDDFGRSFLAGMAAEKRERLKAELVSVPPEELWADLRGAADRRGQCSDWASHRFKELRGKFPERAWNDQPAARRPSPEALEWIDMALAAYAKSQGSDPEDIEY